MWPVSGSISTSATCTPFGKVSGVSVVVLMSNLVGRDAEAFGDQARKHRSVSLAGGLHIQVHGERAVFGKCQRCALERRAAGMLEHAGKPDAPITAAPSG